MRKLPCFFAILLSITCSMTCWSFWFPIGIRMYVFDILAVLFIGSVAILAAIDRRLKAVEPAYSGYFLWFNVWAWGYVALAGLSSILIFINPVGPRAWPLFFNNFSALVVYTLAQSLVVRLVFCRGALWREKFYSFYVGAIIFSCIFMFFEIGLAMRGIDLIRLVFDPISAKPPDFDNLKAGFYAWDGFFRGNGFAGTNAQATYILPCIPLFLSRVIHRGRIRDWVLLITAVVGLLLTQSRGALLGAVIAIVVFFLVNWRRSAWVVLALGFLALPFFAGYRLYSETVVKLATDRGVVDYTRLEMYGRALEISERNPLGIGFGQYAALFSEENTPTWKNENAHNNHLQVLLELGIFGLFCRLGLYGYVSWSLFRLRTDASRAALAGVCGLMVAGCFSSVLTRFQFFFAIAILFAWAVHRSLDPSLKGTRRIRVSRGLGDGFPVGIR